MSFSTKALNLTSHNWDRGTWTPSDIFALPSRIHIHGMFLRLHPQKKLWTRKFCSEWHSHSMKGMHKVRVTLDLVPLYGGGGADGACCKDGDGACIDGVELESGKRKEKNKGKIKEILSSDQQSISYLPHATTPHAFNFITSRVDMLFASWRCHQFATIQQEEYCPSTASSYPPTKSTTSIKVLGDSLK